MYNNLIFEGEYKNGKKWNGQGYDGSKKIVYKLKNDNGIVKEFENSNLIFEGEYLNEKKKWKRKRIL